MTTLEEQDVCVVCFEPLTPDDHKTSADPSRNGWAHDECLGFEEEE